jgi:hypothetical protein
MRPELLDEDYCPYYLLALMLGHECYRFSLVSYNLPTIGGLQGYMVLKHSYGRKDVPPEYSKKRANSGWGIISIVLSRVREHCNCSMDMEGIDIVVPTSSSYSCSLT